MRKIVYILFLIFPLSITSCGNNGYDTGPSTVEVRQNESGQYRLFVNNEEFYVLGAGLEFGNIGALAKYGGNSFRTWRTRNENEDAMDVLDRAYKAGLMVLMGLDVAKERHGFDYNDPMAVRKQFDYIKGEVERLKDHPALLGWAIGNELNLKAENMKVFDAVEDLSRMIHEIDPNHPTTTTLAGIGKREVDYIKKHCTDLDFISIQMYGDIVNLQQQIAEAGWEGPYMVTEWGATGHWEVALTEWGAPIEQTSSEKAAAIMDRYKKAIQADPVYCMGSYVFLWAQKQERTPTWYGIFLPNGNPTETADAMHYLWNGEWPENRCPTLKSFILNGETAYHSIKLKPETSYRAVAEASDPDNDSLTYRWEVMAESTDLGDGGDHESTPETLFTHEGELPEIEFESPDAPGAYRLFVYVTDQGNRSATANIPFLVEP